MDRLEPRRGLKSALPMPCVPVTVITSSHEKQAVVRRRRLRLESAIMKAVDWAPCFMVMRRLGCSWRSLNPPFRHKPALCTSTGSVVGRSCRGTPTAEGFYSMLILPDPRRDVTNGTFNIVRDHQSISLWICMDLSSRVISCLATRYRSRYPVKSVVDTPDQPR
jgi:hypothetical protein